MKLLSYIGIMLVVAFGLAVLLPWWAAAIAGFMGGFFFNLGAGKNFLGAFAALFIAWAGLASFVAEGPLPGRIAELFFIGSAGTVGILAVTGLIGGLTGGIAAIAGGHFRGLFARTSLED